MSGNKHKRGFTLVEVLLFLAISALIIISLMAGFSQAVARQRYNDSVQDLTEFLRKQYSDVITTSNSRGKDDPTCQAFNRGRNSLITNSGSIFSDLPSTSPIRQVLNVLKNNSTVSDGGGRGRSDCNIYGKAIVFGRGVKGTITPGDGNTIEVYDVIGADLGNLHIPGGSDVGASFAVTPMMLNGVCTMGTGSNKYSLQWGARATTPQANMANNGNTVQAIMLIIRSPVTGTVQTFFARDNDSASNKVINAINNGVTGATATTCNYSSGDASTSLWRLMGSGRLTLTPPEDPLAKRKNGTLLTGELNTRYALRICVDSPDVYAVGGQRRMIGIRPNGRNSTAVELIPLNHEDNLCI